MDEVFGEICRHKRMAKALLSRENRSRQVTYDYALVYAKNPEIFQAETQPGNCPDEDQAKVYRNPDNLSDTDPAKRWRIPMTAQGFRPNQMYEIVSPSGKRHRPPEGRCWSMIEGEFKKLQPSIASIGVRMAARKLQRYSPSVGGRRFVPWTWWPS